MNFWFQESETNMNAFLYKIFKLFYHETLKLECDEPKKEIQK